MAKMFYTMEETKAALEKSEAEVKQFTREGRLREFRDGAQMMYRADQVEALKAQLAGGGELEQVDLGPSDSGAPIGLMDSKGGSGTGISLADSGGSGSGLASLPGSGIGSGAGSGLGSGIAGSGLGSGLGSGVGSGVGSGAGSGGSGMMNLREDTSLSADLGLSGTATGVPSPARSGSGVGTGGAGSGGSSGSRSGVNVFGEEEASIDPMAQTAISSSPSELNLESVGSGSGLLDLTRESDDTSLGAELLDEISPTTTSKRSAAPPDTGSGMSGAGGSGVGLEAPRGGITRGVIYQEAADPLAGALGGFALGAAFVLLFGLFVLVSSVYGVTPAVPDFFKDKGFAIIAGICLAPPVVFLILGFGISKATTRR